MKRSDQNSHAGLIMRDDMQTTVERPVKPIGLTSSVIEGFDLQALSEQLMTEDPFTEPGRNALTLVRSHALTIV